MGIYIPNWKMPIHCSVCKFFDHGDCELLPYGDYIDDKHKRRDNCPLIELPPHGDLIDRDALPMSRVEWEDIVNAPTIIEADMDSFIRIFEEDDEEDGMDSFIRILKD